MTEGLVGSLVVLFIAAVSHAQAFLARPELFFAVTVEADFRKSVTARRVIAWYGVGGWLGTAGCLALMATAQLSVATVTFLVAVIWLAAFFVARRATIPSASRPTTLREASLRVQDYEPARAALAQAWGPAVIVVVKAIWVYCHWDQVADRIPVHWGLNGPDRWVDRSPMAVYGSLASIGSISLLIAFSGYATLFRSRTISASGPAAGSERMNRRIGFFGALTLAYVLAIALPPIEGVLPAVPFAPALIAVAAMGMVLALVYSGQGGTRMSESQSLLNHPPVGDRTPDDFWKLGMFYYNPDDPSFIVEKRFGIGWTWNFGHRWSWVVVPAVILAMLLPLLVR
ncbi:MAG TPA: DUF5808 domain-containing protein [Bryobacteraceae bacterium]|nr:DUF5808 domain-containing protein [Bryobacteraceae bacterium]